MENEESLKNHNINSDYNFVASLEQVFESDFSVSKEIKSQGNEENLVATCENSKFLFIEEIKEVQESKDTKLIKETMCLVTNNCNDEINVLKTTNENGNSKTKDPENSKEDQINQGNNSTKITFYCENVDKLMCDLVGEEYDEPIQEITQLIDNSV